MVVLPKVLDILWMCQILFLRILAVEFLEVMNIVFVLIITMMAWAKAEIKKPEIMGVALEEFFAGDFTGVVLVEECKDVLEDLLDVGFVYVVVRVIEPVEASNFGSVPRTVAIEVVKGEEGAGVEVVDVMFL